VEEKSLSESIKLHRAPVRATVVRATPIPPSDGSSVYGREFDTSEAALSDVRLSNQPEDSVCTQDEWLQREIARVRAEERQRVDQFLASLGEQLDRLERSFEEHVVKCALAIAERILKREIARDQEFVLTQVREALKRVVGVSRIQLRIHPSDEALVHHGRAGLIEASDSLREITIEVDETIEPGGCIIESESGSVDAQLSTQLKQIEEALLAGIHS
jgi:hypothetical protein